MIIKVIKYNNGSLTVYGLPHDNLALQNYDPNDLSSIGTIVSQTAYEDRIEADIEIP